MVCGKIGTKVEEESVSENFCAFIISRVYQSYSTYLDKLQDTVIAEITQALSKEFEKVVEETAEEEQAQLEKYEMVS